MMNTKPTKENISPLARLILEGAYLVDVRTPEEFMFGSVPGAVNIPLFTVPLRVEDFRDKDNIIVFCQSGARSSQAKMFLEQSGISCVTNGGGWYEVDEAFHEVNE